MKKRERNRIITRDTSLKGTAVGGPIWALHQQAHTHPRWKKGKKNKKKKETEKKKVRGVTVLPNYG